MDGNGELPLLLPDVAMQLARTGAFNFIPLFAAERKRSEGEAWRAAGNMLSYWLAMLGGALVVAYLLTPVALRPTRQVDEQSLGEPCAEVAHLLPFLPCGNWPKYQNRKA